MARARSATPGVQFESLAFQVEALRDAPEAVARRVVRRALRGHRWRISPLEIRKGEFQAIRETRRRQQYVPLTPAAAWELAYRLRDQPEVVYAEPLFTVPAIDQHPPAVVRGARSIGDGDDTRTEGDYQWSLDTIFVPDAWRLFVDRKPGRGVRIGHPDTGYTAHPEIAGPRLLTSEGFDFEEGDSDASDSLDSGLLRDPGHGTGTASVIMSGAGKPAGSTEEAFVSGVAPFASLVPLRTTRSVVLWSMRRLVEAIRYAIERGCHVISISLGGAPSRALHSAVQDAEQAGVIVLCAAGNQVRFVVFPAAYDEVIAVAASTIGDEEWPGSCRGPAVDITAPGASVWRAEVTRGPSGDQYSVKRGSGTSFAVAATAGVAALWLSYHGRSALIARYGRARLASVFKELLQSTCRVPDEWNAGAFGPGIVHARRLLDAPLPAAPRARGMRGVERRPVSIDDEPFERIVHLLTPASRSSAIGSVADLLRVDEEALPRTLAAVGDELAFNLAVDSALRDRLLAATKGAAAAGVRAGPAQPVIASARRRLTARASKRLRAVAAARR